MRADAPGQPSHQRQQARQQGTSHDHMLEQAGIGDDSREINEGRDEQQPDQRVMLPAAPSRPEGQQCGRQRHHENGPAVARRMAAGGIGEPLDFVPAKGFAQGIENRSRLKRYPPTAREIAGLGDEIEPEPQG